MKDPMHNKKGDYSHHKPGMISFTVAVFALLVLFAYAVNAECTSWYTIRSGHDTPPCPKEFSYLGEHGGYYVDNNADDDDKLIYLTFDAGYENGNVERVVDILDKNGVHGTFFILENLAQSEPELVKKMARGGHTVANHTATHPDMSNADIDKLERELSRLEECVKTQTGVTVAKLFRPPEGKLSRSTLENAEKLGYKTIMWSFAYADWDNENQPDPERSVKKILDNTHNGMVILLHPTSDTNAKILDRLITEWKNAGYRIADINELVSQ